MIVPAPQHQNCCGCQSSKGTPFSALRLWFKLPCTPSSKPSSPASPASVGPPAAAAVTCHPAPQRFIGVPAHLVYLSICAPLSMWDSALACLNRCCLPPTLGKSQAHAVCTAAQLGQQLQCMCSRVAHYCRNKGSSGADTLRAQDFHNIAVKNSGSGSARQQHYKHQVHEEEDQVVATRDSSANSHTASRTQPPEEPNVNLGPAHASAYSLFSAMPG